MAEDWVNPIGKGAQPARIDMGVDYTGAFPLYAMGAGTIVNIYNSGWPGGKFIGLHLDSGQYMYYAENISPAVHINERVTKGQLIGNALGTSPYVEVGWAAPPGTGETMAAKYGQQAKSGDPGSVSTAYGKNMSDVIASLGGPAGILTPGGVKGSVPAGFDTTPTTASLTSATTTDGATLPGCVPLIGWVYLAVQSCIRIGRIQGSKPRHRKILLSKAANQRASGGTNESTRSRRT
jgi:hypothetical protein